MKGLYSPQSVLDLLPPEPNTQGFRASIRETVLQAGRKIVVLDDDPTGIQTVHGINVYTSWDYATLSDMMLEEEPLAFLITNSRSLTSQGARQLNTKIVSTILELGQKLDREVIFISRSDSTLRGHYPLEVLVIQDLWEKAYGCKIDGHVIVPAFPEGGRFTVDDVHYVQEGDLLVPAGQTEFAKDPVFGYRSSDLKEWVQEKSEGRWSSKEVLSLSLETIRSQGPSIVAQYFEQVSGGKPVVVNAASYSDLDIVVQGLQRAEAAGKHFIYRTASSFPKVYGGIGDKPLLGAEDIYQKEEIKGSGGLVVVGSHVQRTNEQLIALKERGYKVLEIDVKRILDFHNGDGTELADEICLEVERMLRSNQVAIVATSREVIRGKSSEEDILISNEISRYLTKLVESLKVRPRFIIGKGGITSSDVATKGLGIKKAAVLGQVLPGVPVVRLGQETRFPGLPYVVFPGNVGSNQDLANAVEILNG
ncbi:MAG: hydroxyacid dehydrogenase [Firmicutes bacterium]|nr:hydroxyacid dehydrogenase [Bacillota bacterium]